MWSCKSEFRLHQGSGAAPFAVAGLYETWQPFRGESLHTCTIVTTAPNALIAPFHDRMPVILPPAAGAIWPDAAVRDPAVLPPLLVPYPVGEMLCSGDQNW